MTTILVFVGLWFFCGVMTRAISYIVDGALYVHYKDTLGMFILGPIGLMLEIGVWLTDR